MDSKTLTATFLAWALIATAAIAPVQADKPTGGAATCITETGQDGFSNDDGDNIFCQSIAAPGGLGHKAVAAPSLAICHVMQPNTPLACGNSAGVAGYGGAIYNVDSTAAGTHQLTAWVKQASGLCGVQGVGCGFDITLCNDLDWDGICTNLYHFDQFLHSQSNEAIVGGGYLIPAIGDLPCVPTFTCAGTTLPTVGGNCTDTDKDVKNCGTDDDAGASFCGKPGPDGWRNGQVITFIGAWIDTWVGFVDIQGFPTNVGAGLSVGTFDAWLVVGASCTLPECDDDIDNDGNGIVDFPADPGCSGLFDTYEAPDTPTTPPECNDGFSNEWAHGVVDDELADDADPDCYDFTGPGGTPVYDPNNSEDNQDLPTAPILPECSNALDDDGNGFTDYPDDTGCSGPTDDGESGGGGFLPECANGQNDDGDNFADAYDPDCWDGDFLTGTYDPTNSESGQSSEGTEFSTCSNGFDDDQDGFADFPADPECDSPLSNAEEPTPCGNSSVRVVGKPDTTGKADYLGAVEVRFTLGEHRILTSEGLVRIAGPGGERITHKDSGNVHVWTSYGPDWAVRDFRYTFTTTCPAPFVGADESLVSNYKQRN